MIAKKANSVGLLRSISLSIGGSSIETFMPAEFTMMTPSMSNVIEMTMMPWPARMKFQYRQYCWKNRTIQVGFGHTTPL
jgi:hypothetical protein